MTKCHCKICGKEFSQKSALERHLIIVHEGQKNHKCDRCPKSFGQAYNLKQHIAYVLVQLLVVKVKPVFALRTRRQLFTTRCFTYEV